MNQHEPGAKLDAGKTRMSLVLKDMPNAIKAVADVGTYGAKKYTDRGWMEVHDAKERYTDALYRHMSEMHRGEHVDSESGLPHVAHAAWNALALLELDYIGEIQATKSESFTINDSYFEFPDHDHDYREEK